MRHSLAALVVTALTLALAACGTASDEPTPSPTRQARASLPGPATAIIPAQPAGRLALATSRALFDRAPVVALASEDNLAGQRAAATLAEQASAPLLLVPAGGEVPATGSPATGQPATPARGSADPGNDDESAGGDSALREELARLDPAALVPYDDAAMRWAEAAGAQPADGGTGGGRQADPDRPRLILPDRPLPVTAPAEPLTSLLVLTSDDDDPAQTLAATVTARAAGARLLAMTGADPRADPAAIDALAAAPPGQVLALGDGFGPPERLRHRLEVAATGVHLPGGGQRVFPGRRMVALYGHPESPVLGVLGEQPVAESVERAEQTAADYQELFDEPVVPVFEIITTIASGSPGPAGDYSTRTPVDRLRPWVDAAAEAGIYVVLDLQPGRTDFLSQAELYEDLLVEPHVGLALDPEWRLAPDQVHLEQIGSVTAAEVNEVADWLAALTREHRLPQKLLVLHQFRLDMITDRSELATGHDELAVLIHADGHGTPGQKLETWRALRRDPPENLWWGWKNFYDEDRPTFTPAETVEVDPSPRFISYQ